MSRSGKHRAAGFGLPRSVVVGAIEVIGLSAAAAGVSLVVRGDAAALAGIALVLRFVWSVATHDAPGALKTEESGERFARQPDDPG